ncbi:MAG: hypothetical protein C0478_17930 [Planctomyces sp.]|nr:hypothetical protein [Planctomyces sp.]
MLNSHHPNADVSHAGGLIRSGRAAEAIPILSAYLSQHPTDTWVLSERAYAKKFTGDYAGAIEDRTEIVRLKPDSPHSFTGRGNVLADVGELRAAIKDFSSAIELDPKLASAYLWRGRAKVQLGELHSALQDFTAAMNDHQTGPGSGLINRGKTYFLLGDFDAAIRDLTAALELHPFPCIHSALYRGIARKSAHDYEGAIADFTLVIEKCSQISNAYRHRAEARRMMGDVSGAEADRLEYERLGGADLPAFTLPEG